MPAATIDEVIAELTAILDWCKANECRAGYFTALYRRVTIRVKEDVAKERFEDNARMERLDVVFALRYIDAFHAWRAGKPTTRCWRIAFENTSRWSPVVLQHMMLGMHAHILLDLGVAAAEVAPGAKLAELETDFRKINDLLADTIDDVQEALAEVSPWARLIDFVGGRNDELMVSFGLRVVRKFAWGSAGRVAGVDKDKLAAEIEALDREVAALAGLIARPGLLLRLALLVVRIREPRSVRRVIEILEL